MHEIARCGRLPLWARTGHVGQQVAAGIERSKAHEATGLSGLACGIRQLRSNPRAPGDALAGPDCAWICHPATLGSADDCSKPRAFIQPVPIRIVLSLRQQIDRGVDVRSE
jgi:hypothetical protein